MSIFINGVDINNNDITLRRISRDYGYVIGGESSSVDFANLDKYDDIANTWTAKSKMITARNGLDSFSLNGYGYAVGGDDGAITNETERYDDVTNTWSSKTAINTARLQLSGYSSGGYGYCVGGNIPGTGISAVTEKYDDVANTWTAKTSLNTARRILSCSVIDTFGYAYGGDTTSNETGISAVTERYNDIANTWTARGNIGTATGGMADFNLNGYGFGAGGWTTTRVQTTQRYDDISNTWGTKANIAGTAKWLAAGFSSNGYGYIAGGLTSSSSAQSDKYDDIANTWTAKATITQARQNTSGFSLGNIKQSVQDYDVIELLKRRTKSLITTDVTASRAVDGTVYTNNESYNIRVTVSAACTIDTAGDNAYMQAFSDTNADPVATASGIIGLEASAAVGEISVELNFIVQPTHKYKIVSTTSAGCSVTLGKWFETIMH